MKKEEIFLVLAIVIAWTLINEILVYYIPTLMIYNLLLIVLMFVFILIYLLLSKEK